MTVGLAEEHIRDLRRAAQTRRAAGAKAIRARVRRRSRAPTRGQTENG